MHALRTVSAAPVSVPAATAEEGGRFAPYLFAAGLVVVSAAWSGIVLALHLPVAAWLAGHVAMCATAAGLCWARRSAIADAAVYLLPLLATLAAGPAGAAMSLVALAFAARQRTRPELLAAWYDRIALAGDTDEPTDLYNTVAMGRALETSTTVPPAFAEVMAEGSLADRQNALGLIARQFSPSYAPALRLALVSPEPVIRVQAAAVAVKVRAELANTLVRLLARADDSALTLAETARLAGEVSAIVASGLIEETDQGRAARAERRLLQAALAKVAAGETQFETDGERLTVETALLAEGDYAGFRALRARATMASAGMDRHHPVQGGPSHG